MPTAPYVDARAPLPPPPAGQRQIQMWISSQPGGDSLVFGAGGGGTSKPGPFAAAVFGGRRHSAGTGSLL